MEKRKYFIQLTSGDKFEISELDFNNIQGRVAGGRSNGWYNQRGETMGTRHQWSVQFKDISSFWSDQDKRERTRPIRDIDIDKRLPPEVGTIEETAPPCDHDWNVKATWEFKKQSVNGMDRYFKVCPKCQAKSTIVKRREVQVTMEADGKTLDDIPNL